MLTMGTAGHTPPKELGEMKCLWMQKSCFPLMCPVTTTTWIWDSGIPSALKVTSLKGLKRTSYWSLTKTETGPCFVNLEILCSESFKTRQCKTRGTSPLLGVEAVALLKSFLSQWWGFKSCSGHVCFCTLMLYHPEVTACLRLPLTGPLWSGGSLNDSMASERPAMHFIAASLVWCIWKPVCKNGSVHSVGSRAQWGVRTGEVSFWPMDFGTLPISSTWHFLCFTGNDILQWILQRLQITEEGG